MRTKIVFMIYVFLFAGSAFAEKKSAKVYGTMNSALDVQNVQDAVDDYENVVLAGSFDFGGSNVVISKDVKIHGETDKNGSPVTVIYGGITTFYAPLPTSAFYGEPFDPGPLIAIKDIHFDGPVLTPILISYTSGIELKNIKKTNVIPFGPISAFGREMFLQVGTYISTQFADPRGDESAVVPEAITGPIVFKDNEIDLELYPPYPPRSPEDTMGQGVVVVWTWGAQIEIKGNTLKNVTRNSIESLDTFKDENGKGSIEIKNNRIITAEKGIDVPSKNTPNGIMVGWFYYPADPEVTPHTSIKGNYIEARGETSFGIGILSPGVAVKNNEIIVKDGWDDIGAAGIGVIGEDAVVYGNQITINPTTGMPGAAGSGIIVASDYAIIKENQIRFDDEVASWAIGISQFASEGMISSNRIEGNGNVAVFLSPFWEPTIQNNMILKNDVRDFIPGWADVVFFTGANFNTLVGEGGTVVDWGTGNVIIGNWITQ